MGLKFVFLFLFSSLYSLKLGLENISSNYISINSNLCFALITNHTGVDQYKKRNLEVLRDLGLKINLILTPEHGFEGRVPGGKDVKNSVDKKSGIKILSLYQADGGQKRYSQSDFKNIDAFVFDIQDVGMRHFTFISTMYKMMELAKKFNKKFVVLDRPNPLGEIMEGPLVDKDLKSFIAIESIPLRHGLTVGELAKYFNKYSFDNKVNLEVVPMSGYNRRVSISKIIKPLTSELRNISSCYGYSITGLLGEVNPFVVGLKTDQPFQCVALRKDKNIPQRLWAKLIILLEKYNINASLTKFCMKKYCYNGIKFNFKDINNVHSFTALIAILNFFKNSNINLNFLKMFDWSVGTRDFQKFINGSISKQKFIEKVNSSLRDFYNKAESILIYKPKPKLVLLS